MKVEFYLAEKLCRAKGPDYGKPVLAEYVKVHIDHTVTLDMAATDEDRERYAEEYAAWKAALAKPSTTSTAAVKTTYVEPEKPKAKSKLFGGK